MRAVPLGRGAGIVSCLAGLVLSGWIANEAWGERPLVLAAAALLALGCLCWVSLSMLRRERAFAALLEEREVRYRSLAEVSPQIIWSANESGAIEYLSPEWERVSGHSEQAGIGWGWEEQVHPADRQRTRDAWHRAVTRGERYEHEYRLRAFDGSYRWMLSRAAPQRGAGGAISKWYGADTDIHELHEAKDALRASEARFRVALQDRDFIVWTQDRELRYTWVYNPAPGYEPERALGSTDREILGVTEDAERLSALKRGVIAGHPFSGEVPLTIKGEQRHYEMRLHPLRDVDGEISGLAGAAYDITTRRRTEEALRRAQQLESISLLAGGVAHDFNNLLTVIIGNATIALSALPGDASTRVASLLESIVTAGESAAVLTEQLLAYAGKGRFQVTPLDLAELQQSLVPLLKASMPRSVGFEFSVEPELPMIEADLRQMNQLLTNLVMNAVEAIGEGSGFVSVTLRCLVLDDATLRDLQLGLGGERSYVQIEVKDNGPGMPGPILERAFEPFFSTKFLGRGLGLSAAQGIVRAHRGAIRAVSEEGRGTRVLAYLPALAASESRPKAPPSAGLPARRERPARERTVLFVDDEAALRAIAEFTLGSAGYRVLLAEHGQAALELVRAQGDSIDVIVLDLTMPVLGGVETAEQLQKMQVAIPIIASSGYSEHETVARFGSRVPLVLRKPYRPAELVEKVRSALAES